MTIIRANVMRNFLGVKVFLLCWMIFLPAKVVSSQENIDAWSMPTLVFEGEGRIGEPAVTSDASGRLHLFWRYLVAPNDSIYYAVWDGFAWSEPVDIIVMSSIAGPSVTIDFDGTLHLVWQGPNNSLYYSNANTAGANSARDWSQPIALAEANPHAQIITDEMGKLHLVFPKPEGGGVGYMVSEDSGVTWTVPELIAPVVNSGATTDFARIAVGENGTIHAVWTELQLPDGWPPLGVYYSKSSDGGQSWSNPFEIAPAPYLEANIAVTQEDVHIIWNAPVAISGRYHRWSKDDGENWTPSETILDPQFKGGSTDPPAVGVDSSGEIHAIVNASYGSDSEQAAFYLHWDGSGWSPELDISKVTPGYVGLLNEASAMTVTAGNRLDVFYVDDDAARLWYITAETGAAGVPLLPVSSIEQPATERIVSTREPNMEEGTSDQNLVAPLPLDDANAQSGFSSSAVLVLGVAASFFFVLLAIIVSKFVQKDSF